MRSTIPPPPFDCPVGRDSLEGDRETCSTPEFREGLGSLGRQRDCARFLAPDQGLGSDHLIAAVFSRPL